MWDTAGRLRVTISSVSMGTYLTPPYLAGHRPKSLRYGLCSLAYMQPIAKLLPPVLQVILSQTQQSAEPTAKDGGRIWWSWRELAHSYETAMRYFQVRQLDILLIQNCSAWISCKLTSFFTLQNVITHAYYSLASRYSEEPCFSEQL
jgi:hypothetical protein